MQHKMKKKAKRGNISTDGIDIEKWAFKANNKTAITFSAWDFAGQGTLTHSPTDSPHNLYPHLSLCLSCS
jgi:GTPase SAR1 family protein